MALSKPGMGDGCNQPNFTGMGGGGGGAVAVAQGWRRFLLDGADYTDDPHSQTASLTESAASTVWTSAGSGTLSTAESKKPDNGAIYTRALVDANGTALDWSRPFSVDFLIESIGGAAHKQSNAYFGFGLSAVTTGLDSASSLGIASWWTSTSSSNYQTVYRFKKNSFDNQGNVNQTWSTAGTLLHGPRHSVHGFQSRLMSYRFDPANPPGPVGDTGMGSYPLGSNKLPASGAVYCFATCGRTQTWGTAKTMTFRVYYAVTGADQDWTP